MVCALPRPLPLGLLCPVAALGVAMTPCRHERPRPDLPCPWPRCAEGTATHGFMALLDDNRTEWWTRRKQGDGWAWGPKPPDVQPLQRGKRPTMQKR